MVALAALTSCSTQQQQWGLGGAAAGAAAGAILGDDSGDVVRGAAIGGAAGVGAGIYDERKKSSGGQNPTFPTTPGQPVYSQPTPPPAPVSPGLPTATVTNQPGIVVSPFPPYNKVNVTGFKSGTKAKDPYTKQIFMVP